MARFAQGKYIIVNPDKYVGNKSPTYRSSWEWHFMRFCDTDTRILKWASEAIKIPYKDPFTGKGTVYVPDFFIQYADAKGRMQVELIEVKPQNQTVCIGGSLNILSVGYSGGSGVPTYQWYSSSTGGTALSTSTAR